MISARAGANAPALSALCPKAERGERMSAEGQLPERNQAGARKNERLKDRREDVEEELDEGLDETFPASDASAQTQPRYHPKDD